MTRKWDPNLQQYRDSGKFDGNDRATAAGGLNALGGAQPSKDWGQLTLQEGSRTPWGQAQHVYDIADGIADVSTAGHGGVKLSPKRNTVIPKELRSSDGWYEEDCDAAIPMAYFPEEFAHFRATSGHYGANDKWSDPDFAREDSIARIKNWYPHQWEAATGEKVALEDSHQLRNEAAATNEAEYRAEHATKMLQTGFGSDFTGIPKGYSVVNARRESTGEVRSFLVKKDPNFSYKALPRIINEHTALDVTDVVNVPYDPAPKPAPVTPQFDTSRLTPAARTRAENELDKLYRFEDGVRTMRESLESQQCRGKSWYTDSETGKTTYYIELEGNFVRPVSKAIFDSASNLSDNTDEQAVAYAPVIKARKALERAQRDTEKLHFSVQHEARRKEMVAGRRLDEARETYEAGEEERNAQVKARHQEYQDRQRAAFEATVAAAGVSFNEN